MPLPALRRPSRAPLRRRPAADRLALLHGRAGAEVPSGGGLTAALVCVKSGLRETLAQAISLPMKLTLIQPTDVPDALRARFGPYDAMFHRMFEPAGFAFETVRLADGQPLPDPQTLDAVLITGSSAGVYDTHYAWMEPLRQFIRSAYAAKTPMLGICFGHQIMADALGGDVRKSDKGWGLGRHVYSVTTRPAHIGGELPEFA